MADLVPVAASAAPSPVSTPAASLLAPLTDGAGGPVLTRLRAFGTQPGVRRMLPWFLGASTLGIAALAWSTFAAAPQRTLYAQLGDGDRAGVVAALDKAAIAYTIDRDTGALSVGEGDYYKAKMLVASDHALATPESGAQMLDSLPIGSSRTLEGERLREAREHDLMLTIMQIDGVESARVHLAEAQQSVFVRDETAPTASVMVRLARGRHLAQSQVAAIVGLIAGSVPGLSPNAVRVVDQSGELLSAHASADADRLELQSRIEDKLRGQVSQLLTPMLGDGNFSSEIQVDLDMDQVSSARESFDKQGVMRSEQAQQSQQPAPAPVGGVPGVLSNTPPPAATPQARAPVATPAPTTSPTPMASDSTSTRAYDFGREVQVSNAAPGKIKRLSIAVAISAGAKGTVKPADLAQLKSLVSAAVGADAARGDQVAVIVRGFDAPAPDKVPFYEMPWFAMLARSGVALVAVVLVLLLGVRPLIKAFRPSARTDDLATETRADDAALAAAQEAANDARILATPTLDPDTGRADAELLSRKVGIAQRLAADKPDNAAAALRQMLAVEPAA